MKFSTTVLKRSFCFIASVVLLVSLSFTACTKAKEESEEDSEESAEVEHNVIKEYVNTPKDKARGVAGKVEGKQDEQAEQAKKIAGE